ncbi:MAG: hypothetical protein H7301_11215 [Cryobacterium sp.]|nr:hypothetical protein [Oligoflexia bacterium]
MKILNLIFLIPVFSLSSFADEASLLGGLGSSSNHYSAEAPSGTTYGASSGLVLKATSDLMPISTLPLVLRGGLFFQNRSYKRTTATGESTTKYKTLGVSAEAAYTALPYVSFSGGAYFSTGLGSVTATLAGGTESSSDFSDVALSNVDYGMKIGARGKVAIAEKISALLDVDYLLGFKDLSTVLGKTNRRDVWILVGASYNF